MSRPDQSTLRKVQPMHVLAFCATVSGAKPMRKPSEMFRAIVAPILAVARPARALAAAEDATAFAAFSFASAAFVWAVISADETGGIGGIGTSRAGMSMFISG